MYYKIIVSDKAKKDINRITEYSKEFGYNTDKVIKKLNEDIDNLKFMPRIHKTVITSKDKNGEYRRIISGKHIIIYQIDKEDINILRVFSEKQNYLNSNDFILKEKTEKYVRDRKEKD